MFRKTTAAVCLIVGGLRGQERRNQVILGGERLAIAMLDQSVNLVFSRAAAFEIISPTEIRTDI